MDTFHSARLTLTAWYLVIIMAVSVLFSFVIYNALGSEFYRFEWMVQSLIENKSQEAMVSHSPGERRMKMGEPITPEFVAEIKQRFLLMILTTNAGILVIAGGLGYFLAGRTLRPIREMMDEQNRFITDASHELKTPLTALRSEFEVAILDEKKLQLSEAKHIIRSGFEEIVNLQGLAENLLELTRQQKRIGKLQAEDVSLLEVIEAVLKKVIPLARHKNITIDNQVDDFILKGESHSLTELFVILLDNAIKYSPKNSEVTITSKESDQHIQIEVKDKGIGIDEKDISQIFDRFYRADTSRSKTAGYGLGLSIARQIVETHKGTISVHSKSGRGTTFTIRLPQAKS